MFGKKGVNFIGGKFRYSANLTYSVIENQPVVAWSLKQAIKEVLEFEADISPDNSLKDVKKVEICLVKG